MQVVCKAECVTDEAARLIVSMMLPGEVRKTADYRIARKVKLPGSRIKNLRQKRAKRIEAHELKALREAAANAEQKPIQQEIEEIRQRLDRLETSLLGRSRDTGC